MRTRSSSNLVGESSPNPTTSNPKRRNRRRSKQPFSLEESPLDTMADQRTMAELLCAPTEGYAEAIVDLLRACPHHGFTELHQLDTFYNALNPADQDSLNSVTGGNLLERRTQDVLTIIENKSKVRNSRNKSIVSQVKSSDVNSSSSFQIAKLTHAVNQQTSAVTTAMTAILKQFQATSPPASVKAVEEIFVTCGGAHPYYQFLAADSNTFPEFRDNIQGYVSTAAVNYNQGNFGYRPPSVAIQIRPPGFAQPNVQNNQNRFSQPQGYNRGNNFNPRKHSYQAPIQTKSSCSLSDWRKIKTINEVNIKAMPAQINNVKNELRNEMQTSIQASMSNQTNELKNMMASFFQMNTTSSLGSISLPGNTIANPKGELKSITTRSGLVLDGPSVPMPPPYVILRRMMCRETLTDPELAEYTIKVPPPLVQKTKPPSLRNYVVHQGILVSSYPLSFMKEQEKNTRENLMNAVQAFLKECDHIPPEEKCMALALAEERFLKVKQALEEEQNQLENHAAKICTPYWKPPIFNDYDDDDDKEISIPLKDIISELPLSVSITPDFLITDSLIMEDEHLDTIPEMESDEEIDDDESLSDEDVPEENFKIYSNPLFDEEIISTKIDPHHFNAESDLIESLLNRDTLIVSSPKFDSLLEEFSGELVHIDLISLEIDEADFDPKEEIRFVEKLLYDNSSPRPPKELNSEISDAIIESFSPYPIPLEGSDSLMEEIDIFLAPDDSIPPVIENDDYDSEGDILEELLNNDSLSLPKNKSFQFDRYYDLSSPRPPAKPPDDDGIYFDAEPDTIILTVKVVDDISVRYVLKPRILPTQPTLSLCRAIDTLLPFSFENEDKVFNPGILALKEEKSPHLLSHRGFKVFQLFFESPMMIYGGNIPTLDVPYLHFYPPWLAQVWGIGSSLVIL
ncbi:hypothetical protein Tco_1143749 [Tanacetum coccineum]